MTALPLRSNPTTITSVKSRCKRHGLRRKGGGRRGVEESEEKEREKSLQERE
jgi:hypothetical protein